MKKSHAIRLRLALLAGCAGFALAPAAAIAQTSQAFVAFDIPAQDLDGALTRFGQQSEREIIISSTLTRNRQAPAVQGSLTPEAALNLLLADSGLTYRVSSNGALIVEPNDPQSGSAAGDGAEGTVEALIVTAQKKEEAIQDVPIAISAFSQRSLEEQKIEGGFDLLKAIPNVTFSKNNFTGYNFSIRGIGTKAISVSTDPGVAVAFNSTTLVRNRLFEQEYYDVERVEVLRGPQGTLYGRNATAGVINVISRKADLGGFEGSVKAEVGNYDTRRISGFVNVPLAQDRLAVRLAAAATQRDGYDYNDRTGNKINGRDLWSARLTIGFQPVDRLSGNFIWERFSEDDDRSRTGKQLCHRDPGPESVGAQTNFQELTRGVMSQGCKPGSLYADEAFGTPNGLSIPFILAGAGVADVFGRSFVGYETAPYVDGNFTGATAVRYISPTDPYGGMMQSRDLRTISSIKDPIYRAETDVFELNIDWDLSDSLRFVSQTAYVEDELYSFQDYNRFNTVPVFNDTSALWEGRCIFPSCISVFPSPFQNLLPGGVFNDPQLGPSDSIAGFDISQSKSSQFTQELRLQSDFDSAINFSVGANYTRYKTLEDYYVMFNLLTLTAVKYINNSGVVGNCPLYNPDTQQLESVPFGTPGTAGCAYVDMNPVESIDGEGHNYYRSKNPYRFNSVGVFGEIYWDLSDALKVTAGLRYTDDRKTTTPIPSQVLLSSDPLFGGGTVDKGYPALEDIKQQWREVTGRLGIDYKPDLSFTDATMLYAFYSRGYKGGGANPPGIGFATAHPWDPNSPPALSVLPYPPTFDPEFVNAFEIGAKNTLLGGAIILNAGAFYYDYKDYQVSQIKDRTAVNENFDADIWGFEIESVWHASRDLRFNANIGYQDTRIADGEKSIDLMNRTAGDPDWMVIKPWIQIPSNCIAPVALIEQIIASNREIGWDESSGMLQVCPGFELLFPNPTPDSWPNLGAGIDTDLSENELPNAPHWTISLGGQHGRDFGDGWRATVRADAYWQSQSWHRVYNLGEYDKLHGWYNVNLSLWIERPEDDLKIELYAKNLLNDTPITDAFLNSDDTALTTNVFVLDPRLIGLSIRKGF